MSIWTVLIVLLVIAAVGGFWSNTGGREFGVYGWSPLGIILLIFLVLLLAGGIDLGPHRGGAWLHR